MSSALLYEERIAFGDAASCAMHPAWARARLTAQYSVDGKCAAAADEQRHGHQKKCQAVLDATSFSRAARQKVTVFPVSLAYCNRHEYDQTQGKGSREESQ